MYKIKYICNGLDECGSPCNVVKNGFHINEFDSEEDARRNIFDVNKYCDIDLTRISILTVRMFIECVGSK